MSLSTAQLADYTGHIDKILAGADLSTVSATSPTSTSLPNILSCARSRMVRINALMWIW